MLCLKTTPVQDLTTPAELNRARGTPRWGEKQGCFLIRKKKNYFPLVPSVISSLVHRQKSPSTVC